MRHGGCSICTAFCAQNARGQTSTACLCQFVSRNKVQARLCAFLGAFASPNVLGEQEPAFKKMWEEVRYAVKEGNPTHSVMSVVGGHGMVSFYVPLRHSMQPTDMHLY